MVLSEHRPRSLRTAKRLAACLTILSGCGRDQPEAPIPASLHKVNILSHDFGDVSVDPGTVRLEHTFRVANGTPRPMVIKDIKKSCGCVEAVATRRQVEPGETTNVTLALELSQSGPVAHGATIVCTDGRIIPMRLQATGTRELEFTPILLERTPRDGYVRMRFCLVGKGDIKENEALEIVSPVGLLLDFDGWHVIERSSAASGRPTRLVGNGRIDFSRFHGTLPVRVTFRAGDMVEQSVQVGEPPRPDCR